jgi:serine protease inhibitor ecotin
MPGMVRHVLQLPKKADENALKVELIIGQTVQVGESLAGRNFGDFFVQNPQN